MKIMMEAIFGDEDGGNRLDSDGISCRRCELSNRRRKVTGGGAKGSWRCRQRWSELSNGHRLQRWRVSFIFYFGQEFRASFRGQRGLPGTLAPHKNVVAAEGYILGTGGWLVVARVGQKRCRKLGKKHTKIVNRLSSSPPADSDGRLGRRERIWGGRGQTSGGSGFGEATSTRMTTGRALLPSSLSPLLAALADLPPCSAFCSSSLSCSSFFKGGRGVYIEGD